MPNDDQQIHMYGAPWCPDCKLSKQFLNEHRIKYEWHDIDEDEKAREYVQKVNNGKQIIPTIVFPDGSKLVEPSNAELADKLDLKRQAEREYYDLVIIGGGPTGLTSAIYAAREGVSTLIIERAAVGGQAGITREIENYPGFPEPIDGADLAGRLQKQAVRFGVEILSAQEVKMIERDGNHLGIKVQTGEEYCTSAVIVATGSTYKRLGVPGEEDFIGAGVHFCATCDGPFYKGKDVVVVGGGNSGFQEGLFLTKFAKSVTILEAGKAPRASKALQEKVASRRDMQVFTETTVQEFKGKGRLSSIVVKDLANGKTREMNPSAVFVFIGLQPNTDLFKSLLDLDKYGFVETGKGMATNVRGVFAAGDCRSGSTKQVAAAVGEGATAALMVRQYLEEVGDVARHVSDESAA
ncbi:MAG: FAD-dependent oxidoreductase [Chloroflexi bacterium]|nr:FAD-dependent oxidoreductase [Chloroflexota bacterium]